MYALESSVFKDTMQLYIFFQVINVAFRVLRQIFMSIVDRRVRYRVRTILFTSIIRQDVVFFDGMSTGQLTNRLADDAMQMLSPLGWALTHLLESSISLVGGLVMCLYTDWKLSILAFTSIYPVIVITQTCACRFPLAASTSVPHLFCARRRDLVVAALAGHPGGSRRRHGSRDGSLPEYPHRTRVLG